MTLQRDILNLASIRQYLHSIPELGLKEFKTADYLADILSKPGIGSYTGYRWYRPRREPHSGGK